MRIAETLNELQNSDLDVANPCTVAEQCAKACILRAHIGPRSAEEVCDLSEIRGIREVGIWHSICTW